jgi:hypothetical protein
VGGARPRVRGGCARRALGGPASPPYEAVVSCRGGISESPKFRFVGARVESSRP